jgi:hypothetical protein
MSIGGFILLGCIMAVFVVFAAVLAWGARQTSSLQGDSARANNVTGFAVKEPAARNTHVRAA